VARLTVIKKRGWEQLTDDIILAVDGRKQSGKGDRNRKNGVVLLLFGKPSTEKVKTAILNAVSHTIICTSHPFPLGATNTNSPFLGKQMF